ncbi:hypothetical protein YC2023_037353 [Brassica napus]
MNRELTSHTLHITPQAFIVKADQDDVDSFMEITDIMERNREETPILSSKHHQTPSLYVVRNCRKSNHL